MSGTKQKSNHVMQFIKLSQTGLTVSRLCLGTGTFGKQTDESLEAFAERVAQEVAERRRSD